MFNINQIHHECPLRALDGDDAVVVYAKKNSVMAECGKRIPKASEIRGFLNGETKMILAGSIDGVKCWGAHLPPEFNLPEGLVLMESRLAFVHPNPDVTCAVSRSRTFVNWRNAHRFCGTCGHPTTFSDSDLAIVCPSCGAMYYPQIAPAVITMITRNNGREVLLAHNKRFSTPSFSFIAGFVEAGESLEQAVSREIFEETGLSVKNIRYLQSQPWPFPNSLMLGFAAEYDYGEPFPKDGELDEIGWFSKDNLPQLPNHGSIARKIIDDFFRLD